jgi:hypothetical protein
MVAVEKTQADIAAMLCRHGAVPDKVNPGSELRV